MMTALHFESALKSSYFAAESPNMKMSTDQTTVYAASTTQ